MHERFIGYELSARRVVRLVALFLCAIICFTIFAGCAGETTVVGKWYDKTDLYINILPNNTYEIYYPEQVYNEDTHEFESIETFKLSGKWRAVTGEENKFDEDLYEIKIYDNVFQFVPRSDADGNAYILIDGRYFYKDAFPKDAFPPDFLEAR